MIRGPDPVHVEVDVHAVGDGLLVAVLHDQVLVEEAERLLGRRRREADQEGVEVLEHLPPEAVDGAVALVDEDHVEGLDRERRVVADRHRLAAAAARTRALVDLLVELCSPAGSSRAAGSS